MKKKRLREQNDSAVVHAPVGWPSASMANNLASVLKGLSFQAIDPTLSTREYRHYPWKIMIITIVLNNRIDNDNA